MTWRDAKRAQALVKSDDYYTQEEIYNAWHSVLTGPHAEILIYSLYKEADRPHIKLEQLDQNSAMFREGKRDIVDQILRIADAKIIKERQNGK